MVSDNTQREIAQALALFEPTIDIRPEYIDVPNNTSHKVIAMCFDGWVWGKEPYTYHGCPYYKVESTTKEMPRDMFEERLRAYQPHKFSWENQIAEDVTLEDISEERLRAAVFLGVEGGRIAPSANGESVEALLSKFGLMKSGKITNGAMMLFGKNTTEYPQLLLRMARFMGNDKLEFLDNQRARGNFFDLLDAGMMFAYKHLNISGKVVGLQRKDKLEIPIEALREALTNALCHRTYHSVSTSASIAIYDDRIEIENPGRLPNDITVENIFDYHPSIPMNPTIAEVLFKTTYLENWGSGVSRMVNACKENNIPTPYYEIRSNTLVIIFKRSDLSKAVSEDVTNRENILLFFLCI